MVLGPDQQRLLLHVWLLAAFFPELLPSKILLLLYGEKGSGKTTTVGKLALFMQKMHKRPLLVAADVYRPAAIDQLKILGERLRLGK